MKKRDGLKRSQLIPKQGACQSSRARFPLKLFVTPAIPTAQTLFSF
jgi:hypothetical protein